MLGYLKKNPDFDPFCLLIERLFNGVKVILIRKGPLIFQFFGLIIFFDFD
ncbi:hypothetical protein HBHAL_4747 [Halobacillus halophilus DSM 2266]|uniref:Uncharacterized protein n=1 Tax=Halobacillus halophilus (strain ATCC 35676 / DSM 2266 / JCM 20832 / KCTC 3685 / LMG 17431 / NBRC 102448 / NCIMB 2269) TaxID=866895 RepID=I0JSG3_HALH3|nr:hypothetical protein HBHAL_4747 [Halobacillus halophilus DSM 2266]